ncbi:MAG: hypothetical protein ACMG6H_06785 [Acidobacteriota bacterium]
MKTEQTRVPRFRSPRTLLLLLIAGVPRIIGGLLVHREPFGDAYCYVEQVSSNRGKILAGTFGVKDLYGFWLPLYQFFSSVISLIINQPFYVSRLVSAVAGAGVCVLVYWCSYILTSSERMSLLAFLAIALNPFHLQYSSAAMTDIPHALMVMSCMYFVLTERWTLAACCGAAAGLIRLESWMLIAIVPTIRFMRQRRIPVLTILILCSAPAIWLFVCWQATGNPLASFQAHDQYVLARLTAHPEFNQITWERTWNDANRLVYSLNPAVLVGCLVGLGLLFHQWRKRRAWLKATDLMVCLSFFFAYFSFVAAAYLTKNQSDIWPRYGLVMFSLGLPVVGYSAQQIFRSPSVLVKTAFLLVLLFGLTQYKIQALDVEQFLKSPDRSQAIGNYLKQQYAADPSVKVFCDHPEIRVVSGIPRGQFYDSFNAPKDTPGFITYLRANGIKFLVIPKENETSTPSQLFPGLVKENGDVFEGVIPAPDDQRTDSLYKVRSEKSPPI